MIVYRWQRILAPTDRSAFSENAVAYARALAKHFGAELHVLRVLDDEEKALSEYAVTGVMDPEQQPDDYSRWMAELVGEHGDVKRIESVRVATDVPEAIVRYATQNDIDLIVMATHGRKGLSHFFVGSVAEQVVRESTCPVLTIRPA